MEAILFILFIYIVILFHKRNTYEFFIPNENQYSICPSNDEGGKGETNISITENKLPKVQTGFFTSLIETTGEKDYSSYFKTPTCSLIQELSFRDFYGNDIVDYDENKKPTMINPIDDQYSKPLDNYSVLYPNIFNDKFVKQHDKSIHKDERF